MAHNESHVCDVALSPTRAKGHVAKRRAAAPRSPSRPAGAAMYIRAVIRSCADSSDQVRSEYDDVVVVKHPVDLVF